MQVRGLFACVAAVMLSHVALAEGDPQAPVGLISAPDVGEAILGAADRPGVRLGPNFRFRVDGVRDNLLALTKGISPMRTQSLDPSRRRRFNSVVDFFPLSESGFHLTAGMRRSNKRARWNPTALTAINIFMPKGASPLRVRTNVARSSPMAMLGWSGELGDSLHFELSAGALQEHGRSMKVSTATIARQQATAYKWSGVGAVASAGMSWRF